MSFQCDGNTAEHCCVFSSVFCRYLEVNSVPNRHWVCGLRRELGDWDLVLSDRRYIEHVAPLYASHGIDSNCRDWPPESCNCGRR